MCDMLLSNKVNWLEIPEARYLKSTIDGESLYLLGGVFDDETIKVFNKIKKETPSKEVPNQTERLSWPLPIDNPSEILSQITELSGKKFTNVKASLWEDTPGYKINVHKDNEDVEGAMQIYLPDDEGLKETGTEFYMSNINGDPAYEPYIRVPFVSNTGYFITNAQTMWHGSGEVVPPGLVRSSVYYIFN